MYQNDDKSLGIMDVLDDKPVPEGSAINISDRGSRLGKRRYSSTDRRKKRQRRNDRSVRNVKSHSLKKDKPFQTESVKEKEKKAMATIDEGSLDNVTESGRSYAAELQNLPEVSYLKQLMYKKFAKMAAVVTEPTMMMPQPEKVTDLLQETSVVEGHEGNSNNSADDYWPVSMVDGKERDITVTEPKESDFETADDIMVDHSETSVGYSEISSNTEKENRPDAVDADGDVRGQDDPDMSTDEDLIKQFYELLDVYEKNDAVIIDGDRAALEEYNRLCEDYMMEIEQLHAAESELIPKSVEARRIANMWEAEVTRQRVEYKSAEIGADMLEAENKDMMVEVKEMAREIMVMEERSDMSRDEILADIRELEELTKELHGQNMLMCNNIRQYKQNVMRDVDEMSSRGIKCDITWPDDSYDGSIAIDPNIKTSMLPRSDGFKPDRVDCNTPMPAHATTYDHISCNVQQPDHKPVELLDDKPVELPEELSPDNDDKTVELSKGLFPNNVDKPVELPVELSPNHVDKPVELPVELSPDNDDIPVELPVELSPENDDKPIRLQRKPPNRPLAYQCDSLPDDENIAIQSALVIEALQARGTGILYDIRNMDEYDIDSIRCPSAVMTLSLDDIYIKHKPDTRKYDGSSHRPIDTLIDSPKTELNTDSEEVTLGVANVKDAVLNEKATDVKPTRIPVSPRVTQNTGEIRVTKSIKHSLINTEDQAVSKLHWVRCCRTRLTRRSNIPAPTLVVPCGTKRCGERETVLPDKPNNLTRCHDYKREDFLTKEQIRRSENIPVGKLTELNNVTTSNGKARVSRRKKIKERKSKINTGLSDATGKLLRKNTLPPLEQVPVNGLHSKKCEQRSMRKPVKRIVTSKIDTGLNGITGNGDGARSALETKKLPPIKVATSKQPGRHAKPAKQASQIKGTTPILSLRSQPAGYRRLGTLPPIERCPPSPSRVDSRLSARSQLTPLPDIGKKATPCTRVCPKSPTDQGFMYELVRNDYY